MQDVVSLLPFLEPGSAVKLQSLIQFLIVGAICAGALGLVYRQVSPAKADETEFAATLFILTIAIGLLVSIIKQAPAISFGLFGAMSIVRFRTQIKKPRRMVFLFMATAIGVCAGAGEYLVTITGTLMLGAVSLLVFRPNVKEDAEDEDDEPASTEPRPAKVAAEPAALAAVPVTVPAAVAVQAPAQTAADHTGKPASSGSLTDGPTSKNVQVYPGGRKHRRR